MRLHVPGPPALAVCAAFAVLAPLPAPAEEISRAVITVDATGSEPVVTSRLTWTANLEGGPRAAVTLWLAPGVALTAARADGRELETAEAGESYGRRGWTVTLPSPLPPGESRGLELVTSVTGRGTPGLGLTETGGLLLPGTGWFPSTAPESDERLAHSIEFLLPAGLQGVGTGDATGDTGWATSTAARPYAIWGDLRSEEATLGGEPVVAWRPPGVSGPLPRADRLGEVLAAVMVGMGDLPGAGRLKIVHAGGGAVAGGLRTLFWDELAAAAPGGDREALLLDRDLAGGWAAAAWSESFRFDGEQAAFLSRAIPLYLGDAAVLALDRSDDPTPTERTVIGSRRADFVAGRESGDRALRGLAPVGPGSAWVLGTRGALVAHLVAEACPSRPMYIAFLRGFRESFGGGDIDATVFSHELGRRFPHQHAALEPFFRGTDLPAFRIVEHGPDERESVAGGERYRVVVENTGTVDAAVELSAFTASGFRQRSFRTFIDAGQTRGVIFRDIARVARIELDARGVVPQARLEDQAIELQRTVSVDLAPFVPAFVFTSGMRGFAALRDFELELESVSIRDFNGSVHWWATHHGPSGMALLGEGEVEIRPGGEHAESFQGQMHKESLSFRGSEMFVRFPLEAWSRIEAQLGEPVPGDETSELVLRNRQIYAHSFPTYFFEESRAQVPPPGSALVLFSLAGDERRGWLRLPLPDGTVRMRLWDHLRGQTIWEDVR